MTGVLYSAAAFLVALGLLVTVHEFGHFWVARRLGVRVLRFSVGFGRPLWRRQPDPQGAEFVIAAVPLGGYVKMLDEREGPVDPGEVHRAFNRKPLATRAAVVVAGPLFNFLFAVLAYWAMFVWGVPGIKPMIGEVEPGSYAAQAGIRAGDTLTAVDGRETPSWDTAVVALLDGALDARPVELTVRGESGERRRLELDLGGDRRLLSEGNLLERLGLHPWRPRVPAVIDKVVPGGAAEAAGLRAGDRVVSADGQPIAGWSEWVEHVRAHPGETIRTEVRRGDNALVLQVRPEAATEEGERIGRIGAYVRLPAEVDESVSTVVRHGPGRAALEAVRKTADMSALTLRTLWSMLLGHASLDNISGPISIAEYAGRTASVGVATFLGFLAIVSVSLGVLNLLPIPVLDGGHLMYYLIELFKGSPVSEQAQAFGQQIGIMAILALMGLAFYNDLARLLG